MSMHKKPLTTLEEIGLIAHGLGEDIGVPSQGADLFRLGIEWALMKQNDRDATVKKMIEHGMPVDPDLRQRLSDLQASQETDQGDCCCGETEEAWRLCPTHGPKDNVFSDNGADIEKRMEEHADISCPACGGSGHKDDFQALQSMQPKSVPLDERMKAAGMMSVSDMLENNALGKYSAHAGVNSLEAFDSWLKLKHEEFIRLHARIELDKETDGDLYEWVIAHAAVLGSVRANFRQALQSLKGEAVEFTCHGRSAPAYSCNKPGDMSGTYYTTPQPPTVHDKCPISGRPFWGNIEHPILGVIATYGGPLDTYSIPRICADGELRCERFDQDAGEWIEGGEPYGWFYEEQQPMSKPPAVPDGYDLVPTCRVKVQPNGSIIGYSSAAKNWVILRFANCGEGRTLEDEVEMLAAAQQGGES